MARAGRPPGFGGLTAYFHWRGRDPWTGAVGHTWNQFKLCKWSFTLVAAVQGAGMYFFLSRLPRPRAAPGRGRRLSSGGRRVSGPPRRRGQGVRPRIALVHAVENAAGFLRELGRQVDAMHRSSLRFIPRPDADPHYTSVVMSSCMGIPSSTGGPTSKSHVPPRLHGGPKPVAASRRHARHHDRGAAVRRASAPPPCGVSAVDLRKAFVVRIDNPDGAGSKAGGGPAVHVGSGATTIELWLPQAGAEPFPSAGPIRRRAGSVGRVAGRRLGTRDRVRGR